MSWMLFAKQNWSLDKRWRLCWCTGLHISPLVRHTFVKKWLSMFCNNCIVHTQHWCFLICPRWTMTSRLWHIWWRTALNLFVQGPRLRLLNLTFSLVRCHWKALLWPRSYRGVWVCVCQVCTTLCSCGCIWPGLSIFLHHLLKMKSED